MKGIGPKTAADLLQRYDTLQGIYGHLCEIKPAVRAKLEHDKEQAFFCEHMAQLVCTVAQPHPLDSLALRSIPLAPLEEFFRRMEFNTLVHRLHGVAKTPFGQRCFSGLVSEIPAAAKRSEKTDQLSLF